MTMLEKVAIAIYAEFENRPVYAQMQMNGHIANDLARVAIAAMREPTASMRTAFWDADEPTDAGFIAGWAAAIDKALEGDE